MIQEFHLSMSLIIRKFRFTLIIGFVINEVNVGKHLM